jgi:hypothetical protein
MIVCASSVPADRGADDRVCEQQRCRADRHAGRKGRLHAYAELLRLAANVGFSVIVTRAAGPTIFNHPCA